MTSECPLYRIDFYLDEQRIWEEAKEHVQRWLGNSRRRNV